MIINFFKSVVASTNYYLIKIYDSLLIHGGKFIGRIVFPFYFFMNLKKYVFSPSYYPEYALKGKVRIFYEQFFYILKTGEINNDYFVCGFDRKNKNDINKYVPRYLFIHFRNKKNQRPLKPDTSFYNYVCLLRDKFVFESICKNAGINTPSNIGFVKNQSIVLLKTKSIISLDSIQNFEVDVFCKKNGLNYGGGKLNVFNLKVSNKEIYLNQKKIDITELKKILGNDNWIIQEKINNQSFEYAKFHPESMNTIRVVTINNNSEINVLFSFFRMGVNGSNVDNWSSGGVVVGVDIKNGTFEKYGLFKPAFGTKCDRHPNTGVIFEGYIIPHWKEIVEYVKKAHLFFYGLHSIGWDVVVTDDGIMIIEGNDNWDAYGVQLYSGAKPIFDKYFK